MIVDHYLLEYLARQRLAELRESAALYRASKHATLAPRRPLRVALGTALIRVGRWLVGHGSVSTHEEPIAGRRRLAA